jgi:hypothetical protein
MRRQTVAEPTDAPIWTPVTVDRTQVVELDKLEWTLSAVPDDDWIRAFRNATANKSGSMDYELSQTGPEVYGAAIVWQVGPADHLDANQYVQTKLGAANAAYPEVLARRAEESQRHAEDERSGEAAIEEAQRRLDDANG